MVLFEVNCDGGFALLPDRRMFEDEPCPVSDQRLGELYRSSSHGLSELIATVSPDSRAMLALYCYRRAHLSSIGLGDRSEL